MKVCMTHLIDNIKCKYSCIRIEIQIFSLHWMMQNISILMSPRFTDIKKPNVLHHPVQGKNLHFNASMFGVDIGNYPC